MMESIFPSILKLLLMLLKKSYFGEIMNAAKEAEGPELVSFDRSKDIKNIVFILSIHVGGFRELGISELFKTKLILTQV
jgi:predicted neutral ceramidase superfamily lipid hydrolase